MENKRPYEGFGRQIKKIRVDAQKSLVDVSGAVELEPEYLNRLEQGRVRPSEDLIILLVSHFELPETDASELWKLAGYNQHQEVIELSTAASGNPILIPMNDIRIIYTDIVNVTANNNGLVINFLQSLGNSSTPMAISRVGMSIDHAAKLLKALNHTIDKVTSQQQTADKSTNTSTEAKSE